MYKTTSIPFVDTLHFCTTFYVIAFWMLDVWHKRCIQLTNYTWRHNFSSMTNSLWNLFEWTHSSNRTDIMSDIN